MISLGFDLGELVPSEARVERWDDVPSPSQDLSAARAAIRQRLLRLVDELEAGT